MKDLEQLKSEIEASGAKLAEISGGDCSPEAVQQTISDLRSNYEALVDFVSHVIERVAN
ncbi:hypothetical protein [Usitatibacter palustris]|uniref:Uncharacterized protein n=1 Tax=Usitatibacter palustris TaxID=2732487 RepID=A0A6M4HCY1_9PROT|nr:hypothetical protein [Usitatibacter palustris]QJR16588.1 hypothetical protein DSM104440_03423 [Usitatibacter palustris]